MAKKKTIKELSDLIPSKIESHGHHGNLTIMKRSNDKYFCYYPFSAKKIIPTTKGKSITAAMQKMYDELLKRDIVEEVKKIRKIKKRKFKVKRNPLTPKQKMKIKLSMQNKNLKNK